MRTRIVIADDFTGAGDSGVHFARGGGSTALLLDPSGLERDIHVFDALSLSTESRFLAPGPAAATVRDLARRCVDAGGSLAFKKVDSTLRGNLGAEIEAVLSVSGHAAALVCTAMPKTGRVCRDGLLYLKGALLHTTEIGRDPFNPVSSSAVAEVLAGQTALPVGNLTLAQVRAGQEELRRTVRALLQRGCRILVADAESDADLAALGELLRCSVVAGDPRGKEESPAVAACVQEGGQSRQQDDGLPSLLPVGAGGLAEAFAALGPACKAEVPKGRMLAVVGSLTGVSREQAEAAVAAGDFYPLTLDVAAGLAGPQRSCAELTAQARAAGGKNLLLRTASNPDPHTLSTAEGNRAAALFGEVAAALCRELACPVLYATGGSTAVALAGALKITSVRLEEECLPGVVLSSCADTGYGVRWFISKAGGFGAPGLLCDLAARFSSCA